MVPGETKIKPNFGEYDVWLHIFPNLYEHPNDVLRQSTKHWKDVE